MHTIFILVLYWIGAMPIMFRYSTGSIYKFSYFYFASVLQTVVNSVISEKKTEKKKKEKKNEKNPPAGQAKRPSQPARDQHSSEARGFSHPVLFSFLFLIVGPAEHLQPQPKLQPLYVNETEK
jgi:hypothetical protein